MDDNNTYDLIEAYIGEALPDEQRLLVEQRMAEDEAFRQEVNLHRELQEHFEDAQRWRLSALIKEVMAEPLPSEKPPGSSQSHSRSFIGWWLIPLALLIGVGIWLFFQKLNESTPPKHQKTAEEPETLADDTIRYAPDWLPENTEQQPSERGVATQDSQEKPATSKPPTPPPTPEKQGPIAQANPEAFAPNKSMEDILSSRSVRGLDTYSVNLTSPIDQANFIPESDGKATVRFTGKLERKVEGIAAPLQIVCFSTMNINEPLLEATVEPAEGTGTFDLQQKVDFPPGLYYFLITLAKKDVYVGTFTIRQQ
jgi:hypothetical protein